MDKDVKIYITLFFLCNCKQIKYKELDCKPNNILNFLLLLILQLEKQSLFYHFIKRKIGRSAKVVLFYKASYYFLA